MNPATIATAAALLISAIVGAVIALAKRRPETASVLVTSASAVVIIQRDLIEDLRTDLDRLEKSQADLRREVHDLSRSKTKAEGEVRSLTLRVEQLEEQLRRHDIPVPPPPEA